MISPSSRCSTLVSYSRVRCRRDSVCKSLSSMSRPPVWIFMHHTHEFFVPIFHFCVSDHHMCRPSLHIDTSLGTRHVTHVSNTCIYLYTYVCTYMYIHILIFSIGRNRLVFNQGVSAQLEEVIMTFVADLFPVNGRMLFAFVFHTVLHRQTSPFHHGGFTTPLKLRLSRPCEPQGVKK